MAGTVKAIDRRSVHQICSGQVVLNLATAIKELVENSLDAGATNIEIKLKEYGSESIEVSDNGTGVEETNFAGLTLKHHTSKLRDFSDLSSVDTFGFRGEALSSLCALSDLTVVTCHETASVGTRISYNHDGHIVKQVPCPRQQGTTVILQNLFFTLPVRHKEFLRNVKKEFAKMVQILQAYCIIASGVKLTCTNQPDKGKKSLVVSTNGTSTMRESIANVFGSKQLQSLLEFSQIKPGSELCEEYGLKEQQLEKIPFSLSGFVSKCDHGQGRSAGDRQYFFINRRPCDFPKVNKLINEVYHTFNRHQYPFVVLDISLAKDAVDVNVTPDKRKVLLQEEKTLLAILKASLHAMFEPRSSSYDVNQKPLLTTAPSGSALATMFGRGRCSSDHSPAGRTQPGEGSSRPGVKLNLSNLKRSFAHANHSDDERLDKKPKQPKLDTFFLKSPDVSEREPSDECEPRSSETAVHGDSLSPTRNRETAKDTSGNLSPHMTDDSRRDSSNAYTVTSVTLGSGRTMTADAESCGSPEPVGARSSQWMNSGGIQSAMSQPTENSTACQDAGAISTSPAQSGGGSTIPHEHRDGVRGKESAIPHERRDDVKGKGSHDVEERLDGESGFCESSSSIDGSGGMESSEPSTTTNSQDMDRAPGSSQQSHDASCDSSCPQEQKQIIHKMDEMMPVSTVKRREVNIPVSMAGLRRASQRKECVEEGGASMGRSFRAKIAPSDNASAEEELKREISKDMFGEMEILGQFNLGFIIARYGSDLFIIDQHATDEKYNFETLQKHTALQGQKLIQPLRLELTAVNESILMDNLEIFQKNGFDFSIDEDGIPTQRIKLVSQPTSRNWTFGKDDIDELIFMLSDAPGVLCRPTRVRQMFASRACRKSIMIGTALTKADMKKLVCHMGELDQPWNCPHGRPTMRHLFNLNMIPD